MTGTFDGVLVKALTDDPILLNQLWYWASTEGRTPETNVANMSAAELAPRVRAVIENRLANDVDWLAVTTALLNHHQPEPSAPAETRIQLHDLWQAAAALLSDDAENAEYDRAICELVIEVSGGELTMEDKRAIYVALRAMRGSPWPLDQAPAPYPDVTP